MEVDNCTGGNCSSSDVNVSDEKSIHPFQDFSVGLPTIAFTATSRPDPKEIVTGCEELSVYRVKYVTMAVSLPTLLSTILTSSKAQFSDKGSNLSLLSNSIHSLTIWGKDVAAH